MVSVVSDQQTFQAYLDDSGSEPSSPIFFLAGFIASESSWRAFEADWLAALNLEPKLDYFKMKEAFRLQDQFHRRRGWTEAKRDERLMQLVEIIKAHALVRVCSSIKNADFDRYVKSLDVPERKHSTDNPFWMLLMRVGLCVAIFGDQVGAKGVCNFICDEQLGAEEEMRAWWPTLAPLARRTAEERMSKSDLWERISPIPEFGNDKVRIPLQAADLYAWQLRKHHERNQNLLVPEHKVLRELKSIQPIEWHYETDEMLRLNQHLKLTRAQFINLNPGRQLYFPSTDKRERKRARQAARRRL